ncbi:ankyrin repeat domain-containing protein [Aquimarina brevivitae]|uniref:Lipocalin-like protein n=1 Tax=Aquimarina brevivitae TaxID=323412 RepID=A0A4Q7NUK6_9FLAO|nr:ankyrin repeat domain-containing protein [Aquimarina brevivitae]RZS90538.1 lipocalin-like protein [Aquimarina brevivitae]
MTTIKQLLILSAFILVSIKTFGQQQLNVFDKNGKTPLLNAITTIDVPSIKKLIKNGADVNLKEQSGLQGTPLMYATSTGNLALCKLLFKSGADINLTDTNKDSALNWATYYGHVQIMNYLISKGADYTAKSKHGTALDVALRLWHNDSVIEVFRPYYTSKKHIKGERKLIEYVSQRQFDKIINKWNTTISFDLKDNLGIPLLQYAVQSNHKKLTQFLITNGATIDILNPVGQTPLAWAARKGHLEMVELLLEAGADPNKTDSTFQLTPLIAAAIKGDTEIGKLLLQNNANLAHRDVINNATALHWAVSEKNTEFAKMLVHQGADYHNKALQDDTYSAYDLAQYYKNNDLLSFFNSLDNEKKQSDLIGSWKVKEIHYLYPDTIYRQTDLEYGRFLLTKNKYSIVYNPTLSERIPFKNLSNPEDAEIKKAFLSIVFNSGSYNIVKDILRTTADIAKVPGFEGGQQSYTIKLEDANRLQLVLFDETYPNGKKPEWLGKIKVRFVFTKEK